MTLGELIKDHREKNRLSQRKFALRCGLSNGYISMLEDGKNPKTGKPLVPKIDKIMMIADGMGYTLTELLRLIDDMDIDVSALGDLRPIKTKRFPMLGEIACGEPIFANEDHETYIDASADIKADFCLTAKGDSMIGARIHDGDVVFIRSQPVVDNGQIAAVIIGDEATLKRWYFYPNKKKLVLTPENPAYEPLVYMGDELDSVRCLGLAVAFMSNL